MELLEGQAVVRLPRLAQIAVSESQCRRVIDRPCHCYRTRDTQEEQVKECIECVFDEMAIKRIG